MKSIPLGDPSKDDNFVLVSRNASAHNYFCSRPVYFYFS